MREERRTYYEKATSWAVDEQASMRASLRQARLFALAAVVIAVLEAFALLLLMPLKTVTPIPVLVDRQTGFVEVLKGDGRREIRANDALSRAFLAQYVVARENFDITQAAADYRKVALWSADAARRDYLALMPATNPQSPLRRYPRSTIVDTRIKSVSPLGSDVALVRFQTTRRDDDGRAAAPQDWASVIAYKFVDAPMSVEDRLTNPLGFQVVRYHRDPEAASAAEPGPPQPTPISQPSLPAPAVNPPATGGGPAGPTALPSPAVKGFGYGVPSLPPPPLNPPATGGGPAGPTALPSPALRGFGSGAPSLPPLAINPPATGGGPAGPAAPPSPTPDGFGSGAPSARP